MENIPKPEHLAQVDFTPDEPGFLDPTLDFEKRRGTWSYSGAAKNLKYLDLPFPRSWSPADDDWQLPENWQDIVEKGLKERVEKFRSFQLFMDICVRCGACADKCHFYIGSGDPKNMPVARAELLRSVYKEQFTWMGKLLNALDRGGLQGAAKFLSELTGTRRLTVDVIKEWFYYFFQCTECRRCSIFCPYGIDTAEITMMGRELLLELGLTINWIIEPVANCFRTGNHLGIQPHTFQDNLEFICDDIEDLTGVKLEPSINRKGAEILFIVPSADIFADPAIYGFMGYLLLFEHLGLDYTLSAYASEGGNFGLFTSHEMIKRLNNKMYHEAERLGVKWILGGECGHMWRVVHQYMDTMNGPADFLEVPVSPITGTRFDNTCSTKMVHICEFTADLIKNNKLKLDKSRNDNLRVTFHDSCNPARGMGILEEPRYIIRNVCNHFVEMPENTIKEQTFCCGGGAGLGNDENMEMRLRGGLPRGNATKYVHDKYGVNRLACICAIDKATLPPLMEYWVDSQVEVMAVHELVGNALIMADDEKRTVDLRGEPLPGVEEEEEEGGSDDV